MRGSSYIQWYNENEGRAYPLSEHATGVSRSGRRLPEDILVDMNVMVPPAHAAVYVRALRITNTIITVGLCSELSGLLVGTYARSQVTPNVAYPLTPLVPDVSGWVVFGNHLFQGLEDYRFGGVEASGLEQRAIRVVDALPVKKFVRFDGRMDKYADRIVRIQAGNSILVEQDSIDPQRVIVKLKPDMQSKFMGPCNDPATGDSCGVPPMRQIAGVCPDADGTITIRFE